MRYIQSNFESGNWDNRYPSPYIMFQNKRETQKLNFSRFHAHVGWHETPGTGKCVLDFIIIVPTTKLYDYVRFSESGSGKYFHM